MKKQTFIEWLEAEGACSEGIAWAKANKIKTAQEAWDKLPRTDWMLWLAEKKKAALMQDEKKLRHFAADCAEDVLPIFERAYPNDDRPRKAIKAARDFADGKIDAAAWAAAGAAAGAAAWAAQSKRLRKYFKKLEATAKKVKP